MANIDDIQHPAKQNALKRQNLHEIRLTYEADIPARSGLGTSSTFVVRMLNTCNVLKGKFADKRKLADEAILSVNSVGKQVVGKVRSRHLLEVLTALTSTQMVMRFYL